MKRFVDPRRLLRSITSTARKNVEECASASGVEMDRYGFPRVPHRGHYTREKCNLRRQWTESFSNSNLTALSGWWDDAGGEYEPDILRGNIEAPIGLVRIPLGVAGPLLFNGNNAKGMFLAPMATTEGALVASATRGATAINASGGVTTSAGTQKVTRAPLFLTESPEQASVLAEWLSCPNVAVRLQKEVIHQHSSSAVLKQILTTTDLEAVHALFVYSSGDAAGQNMTTTTTWEAMKWIHEVSQDEIPHHHLRIVQSWVEGGLSGDKRSVLSNLLYGRGTCATASVFIPEPTLQNVLKIDTRGILNLWKIWQRMAEKGGGQGACLNVSNMIAAVFTATGQDIACVAESCLAQLSLQANEVNGEYGVQAKMQLPCLMVGTVGGGTSLPTQQACLHIMDCYGAGNRAKLAEIIAGYALALDLSTLAALASNQFALSHERLGRNRPNVGLLPKDLTKGFFEKPAREMGFDLISWTPTDLQDSSSILSDLTKSERSMKKLVGLFAYKLTLLPKDESVPISKDVVLKSKATDGEVINMLNKIAQGCGGSLAKSYSRYRNYTGFKNVHRREVTIATKAMSDPRLQEFMCKIYTTHTDEEHEQYLIWMENFSNADFTHLNSANDIQSWDTKSIHTVLRNMAEFHAVYFNKCNLLGEEFGDILEPFPKEEDMLKMSPLWTDLLNYNAIEFPEMWTTERQALTKVIIQNLNSIWKILDRFPKTMVHNDFNPRNLCIRKATSVRNLQLSDLANTEKIPQDKLCLYDWELAAVNVPQRDLVEFLSFVLDPDTSDSSNWERYIDFYIEHLCHSIESIDADGAPYKISKSEFKHVFEHAMMEFVINRLALYSMAHTFKDYVFLPRVINSAFKYLQESESLKNYTEASQKNQDAVYM